MKNNKPCISTAIESDSVCDEQNKLYLCSVIIDSGLFTHLDRSVNMIAAASVDELKQHVMDIFTDAFEHNEHTHVDCIDLNDRSFDIKISMDHLIPQDTTHVHVEYMETQPNVCKRRMNALVQFYHEYPEGTYTGYVSMPLTSDGKMRS